MADLLKLLIFSVIRCWHFNNPLITCRSRQQRSPVASITGTYFVCLGCREEYAYDMETGRVIDLEPARLKLIAAKLFELCTGRRTAQPKPGREML